MSQMQVTPVAWYVEVPPGTYFLGDPCYAVPQEHWMPLLESCDFFNGSPVGIANGVQVLAFETACGDGTYYDRQGNAFGVDAGLIGLTPIELARQRIDRPTLEGLGLVVTFTKTTRCTSSQGFLHFGPHRIATDI